MPDIKLGSTSVENFMFGTEQVEAVYFGNELMWEYNSGLVRITIAPTPADANVVLTAQGYTQAGNSIRVAEGTIVSYTVSRTGYASETDTYTAGATDHTISVSLVKNNYTLTVNTTPADAIVNFDTGTISGHDCTVPYDTEVNYTISKTGYVTSQTYTYTVTQTESITAPALEPVMCTLTINPTPNDAEVSIVATGYSQVGNTITVPYGTSVSYQVSKTGYDSEYDTITLTSDQTLAISLDVAMVTLSITPTPNDATVVLTATGYSQEGNSITVAYGTPVSYSVSKTNYTTVANTISSLTDDTSLTINLVQNGFTLTINPTPADANVELTANGYTQSTKSITVPANTAVRWKVSKSGYITQTNTLIVSQDQTMNITLESGACVFTVSPRPIDAQVTIMDIEAGTMVSGVGEQSKNTSFGNHVRCIVSKEGYDSKDMTIEVAGTTTMTISLEAAYSTITLMTNVQGATITLLSDGATQAGNSITVQNGSRVDYSIEATGYTTRTGTLYADGDKTYNLPLSTAGNGTFTIIPYPAETTITMSCPGYPSVSGTGEQSISVASGSTVTYSLSYNGTTYSNETLLITNDVLLEIDMTKPHGHLELRVHDQNDSSLQLSGYMRFTTSEGTYLVGPMNISNGTKILVPAENGIKWICWTENYSHNCNGTQNVTAGGNYSVGSSIPENTQLTLTYSPSTATIVVKDCVGTIIPALTESSTVNTYYTPWYTSGGMTKTMTIIGYATGYQTKTITAARQNYRESVSATLTLNPL